MGLFFDKTPCPGSTNIIHRRKGNHALYQRGKLGVLSPNLYDGINFRIQFNGCAGMSSDLVDYHISSDDLPGEFPSRARSAGTDNYYI